MLPVLRSTAVVHGKTLACATEYSVMRGAASAVPAIARTPAPARAATARRMTMLGIGSSSSFGVGARANLTRHVGFRARDDPRGLANPGDGPRCKHRSAVGPCVGRDG